MPRGIKKPTAESLRASMDKQFAEIREKEAAIKKAKEEYEVKVKRLKSEISAGNSNMLKLRKEYIAFVQNEQQETMKALLFNGNLSDEEIAKAINAMKVLFNNKADHERAIHMLQEIADQQQNSTITNLVNEIGQKEAQKKPENENRGLGESSPAAEQ